jgi:hypothetical protein
VADFFFNCWYLEITADNYSAHTKVHPLSCARPSTGNVPEFLRKFLGELHIVDMVCDPCFSSCNEGDMDQLGSVSFQSLFFKPVLDCR